MTQFTHKCPITEQSNSRDINDLMQLVLTKQLLSVDSSSSCSPSQPNTCNNEGVQQAIEGLNNSIAMIIDRLDSLTDAVSKFSCPDNYCRDSLLPSCEAIYTRNGLI